MGDRQLARSIRVLDVGAPERRGLCLRRSARRRPRNGPTDAARAPAGSDGGDHTEYRLVLSRRGRTTLDLRLADTSRSTTAAAGPRSRRTARRDSPQTERAGDAAPLQQQIAHVGRVSTMGQLASALAHESISRLVRSCATPRRQLYLRHASRRTSKRCARLLRTSARTTACRCRHRPNACVTQAARARTHRLDGGYDRQRRRDVPRADAIRGG